MQPEHPTCSSPKQEQAKAGARMRLPAQAVVQWRHARPSLPFMRVDRDRLPMDCLLQQCWRKGAGACKDTDVLRCITYRELQSTATQPFLIFFGPSHTCLRHVRNKDAASLPCRHAALIPKCSQYEPPLDSRGPCQGWPVTTCVQALKSPGSPSQETVLP